MSDLDDFICNKCGNRHEICFCQDEPDKSEIGQDEDGEWR